MSILNVIKEIRGANKRPDNQAILDRMNKTSATNVNRNHIDKEMFYVREITDVWQTNE